MGIQSCTLRQVIYKLNNETDDGGFWLPNIQKSFVWTEEQICKLFDSILREYPINTLLIWKTKDEEVQHRKFIQRVDNRKEIKLSELKVPCNAKTKNLVLDGQQRLQSLYIGLRGEYEGKELFFNALSGDAVATDAMKYEFKFMLRTEAAFPWVLFNTIVDSNEGILDIADGIVEKAGRDMSTETRRITRNIDRIQKAFSHPNGIVYQELDGVDRKDIYTLDEVVEIFIRVNSGGTRLSKSDLMFSLLSAGWDEAIGSMEDILGEINGDNRYRFDRDFILKVCLTLLHKKAAYREAKFREAGVRESIEENWDKISDAIKKVIDYLSSRTYLRCEETLSSDQVLIPLINFCYHCPVEWKNMNKDKMVEINDYLVRILLTGSLSKSHADSIIDRMIDSFVKVDVEDGIPIVKTSPFDKEKMFDAARADGLSVTITEDRLWDMGYGSVQIHLLFNLWYDFNYRPAFSGNKPQIDHIFPQSKLKPIRKPHPETGKMALTKYPKAMRDQLANCMLLTADENGRGGKTDILPEVWFADKDEAYLNRHLIPRDKELWKLDNFEAFIEARKMMIKAKFKYLLAHE